MLHITQEVLEYNQISLEQPSIHAKLTRNFSILYFSLTIPAVDLLFAKVFGAFAVQLVTCRSVPTCRGLKPAFLRSEHSYLPRPGWPRLSSSTISCVVCSRTGEPVRRRCEVCLRCYAVCAVSTCRRPPPWTVYLSSLWPPCGHSLILWTTKERGS